MEIWILATLAAALVQTLRFMLQKQLKGAGLSTGGATFSRFVFAVPLAGLATLAAVLATGADLPRLPPEFWLYGFAGGVGQIVATFCTVALFSLRNFAIGIAFTKSETVLVALFSALVLGEAVSAGGMAAILTGLVGVLLMSLPKGQRLDVVTGRALGLGVLAGAMFGLAAIGYRGASLSLGDTHFMVRAALTLFAVTAMQTLSMALWLGWREPGEVRRVLGAWRATALVGLTGMLGSLGWFIAFTLQNAAYVRALGQIELVFSILAGWLFFRERISGRELIGILLLTLSLLALILLL